MRTIFALLFALLVQGAFARDAISSRAFVNPSINGCFFMPTNMIEAKTMAEATLREWMDDPSREALDDAVRFDPEDCVIHLRGTTAELDRMESILVEHGVLPSQVRITCDLIQALGATNEALASASIVTRSGVRAGTTNTTIDARGGECTLMFSTTPTYTIGYMTDVDVVVSLACSRRDKSGHKTNLEMNTSCTVRPGSSNVVTTCHTDSGDTQLRVRAELLDGRGRRLNER